MARPGMFSRLKKTALSLALLTTTAVVPLKAFAQDSAPLEVGTYILPGMATADTLPKGALLGAVGQQQGAVTTSGGTGTQLYHYHLEYGVTDRLQIGTAVQRFEDPAAIGGGNPDVGIRGISGQVAYKFVDSPQLKVVARASVEQYEFRSQFWSSRTDDERVIGSFHIPAMYKVNDALALHFSAGVSYFPDQLNGVQFYGVIPQVGIGATARVNERLSFYGLVNMPFGENGNSISDSGAIENVPVWTVGGSFNVTPKMALDLYATNGLGATPATQILTFFPGGDDVVLGARLTYTPGVGRGYRPNYRGISGDLSARQKRLQFHGLTMASGDTLDPGTIHAWGGAGSDGYGGGGGSMSTDHDIEVGLAIELYSQDGTVPVAITPGTGTRYRLSAKLRLLDQHNGSPFSMSGLVVAGRSVASRLGSLYVSTPMSYEVNDRLSVSVEPKFGAFGSQRYYGLAAGANYELFKGFDVIGEAGVIEGANGNVWAAGARYTLDALPVSVELMATNTIGNHGVGSMIAQDNIRYSAGFKIALDGKPLYKKLSRVTLDRLR